MNLLANTDLITRFGTLFDIGVLLGVGVVASLLMARLKLPAVAGLLLAGALCGPYGFGLARDLDSIQLMSEIGVVLLMFTIGLQYPLSKFRVVGFRLLFGGVLQVGMTSAATAGICLLAGLPVAASVVIGFAVAHTSTPVVMRALADKGEVDAPHGRFIVGTSIFQDLCVIPMLLTLPILKGQGSALDLLAQTGKSLGLAAVAVVVAYFTAKLVLPLLLRRVDGSRVREIFLLAVVSICIGMAFATGAVGLSMALGAFVAGIVLAESEFANRAMSDIIPLRDIMTSIFFISLGMLFDARAFLNYPLLLPALVVAMIAGKGLLASLAALFMRFPARASWIAGLGLAQFGEFGFVVMNEARAQGLLAESPAATLIFAAGALTLFVNPILMRLSPFFTAGERMLGPVARLMRARSVEDAGKEVSQAHNHVVIAGYGVGGRAVAAALRAVEVPYFVLEMNVDTVRTARLEKEPVYYADVTSEEALESARLRHAAAFVLTINDPGAVARTLDAVRRHAPEVPVLARAHFLRDAEKLRAVGASDVVTEELEAAVEIMARVLRLLGLPRNVIDREVALVRQRTQDSARSATLPRSKLPDLNELADLKVESALVNAADFARGKTLMELNLRARTGASVIALRRDGLLASQPRPDEPLRESDILYMVGSLECIRDALAYLETGVVPQPLSETMAEVQRGS